MSSLYVPGSGSASGGSSIPGYLGPVASRAGRPHNVFIGTSFIQGMSFTMHQAKVDMDFIQIAEANWYLNTGASFAETGFGGAMTVQSEVWYNGAYTPILWSGVTSGSVATNTNGYSDITPITRIPKGAWFGIARFRSCATGLGYCGLSTFPVYGGVSRDVMNYSSSTVTNTIGTGTLPTQSSSSGPVSFPAAIYGYTNKATVGVIGDSKNAGSISGTDSTPTASALGEFGEVSRPLGAAGYAVLNISQHGRSLSHFTASHNRQVELLSKCSHIDHAMGANDLGGTAASIAAAYVTHAAYFTGKTHLGTSLSPIGSADNITPGANNATRNTTNIAKLVLPAPFTAIADVNKVVESGASGSGIWTATYSTDWTHATEAGYAAIEASTAAWLSTKAVLGAAA